MIEIVCLVNSIGKMLNTRVEKNVTLGVREFWAK